MYSLREKEEFVVCFCSLFLSDAVAVFCRKRKALDGM
jgi:hypothetical protein